jgi:hypothetical protein
MSRRTRRTYRRVTAALALLGVAFYTLLLPWHLTSQFEAQLFKAEFGPLAQVMCTSGGATDPAAPGLPSTSCPICKGLAAFQLALASAPQPALPMPAAGSLLVAPLFDDVAGALVPSPRSRGPPLPA